MGGASVLGGCHLMKERNNQLNDDVGGVWDVGEATRLGGTCGGGRLPVIWGEQIEQRKNKNRERVMGPRFLIASSGWVDTTVNQESAQSTEYSLVKGSAGR